MEREKKRESSERENENEREKGDILCEKERCELDHQSDVRLRENEQVGRQGLVCLCVWVGWLVVCVPTYGWDTNRIDGMRERERDRKWQAQQVSDIGWISPTAWLNHFSLSLSLGHTFSINTSSSKTLSLSLFLNISSHSVYPTLQQHENAVPLFSRSKRSNFGLGKA